MKKMMRKHSKNFLWLTYFSDFVALVFAHSQHTGIVLFTTEIEYLKAIFENKYRYNYSLHRYWTLTYRIQEFSLDIQALMSVHASQDSTPYLQYLVLQKGG